MARVSLERVDQKIDGLKELVQMLVEHIEAQNGRIRKLENWRSWIAGAVAAVSVIGGWLFYKVL